MKRLLQRAVSHASVSAALLVLAVAAGAQGGPGPGPGRGQGPGRGPNDAMMIVRMSTVQKELGLSQAQVQSIEALRPRRGGGQPGEMGPPPRPEEQLSKILNQAQSDRLKQLAVQFGAPMSILRDDVASQIGVKETQRDKIHEIVRNLMPPPDRGQDSRRNWSEMQKRKAQAFDQAWALLDQNQRAAYNRLAGKPFNNWVEPTRP